jgi:ubiquitin-activating enzyme E1 C
VVGAGGLGCEILKDLALSGIPEIHVIDLDNIDISNLNRQFLFRMADVGRGKAEVAAEFIMRRVPGCRVIHYHKRIQEFDTEFYRQFKVIVSGLDNIEARRWLNSLLVSMVEYDEDGDPLPESIIPLVDGGTEGFKGQARVIIPKITSCFECSIESFPPQKAFPMCTIAETPRLPEHCIAYAFIVEWPNAFGDRKLDKDSPADMTWVYEKALERANRYSIQGVTYFKTIGVVKNIIPAVASTNAIIAAACTNEAFKLLTFASQSMNTYFMYMGNEGIYSNTFEYARKEGCIVCSDEAITRPIRCAPGQLLRDFIVDLCADPMFQLKKPSLTGEQISLYLPNPPSLEAALRGNLDRTMESLVHDGEIVAVTDPMLVTVSLNIQIEFA